MIRSSARRLRIGVLVAFGGVLLLVICGHLGVRVGGAPVLLQSKNGVGPAQVTISDGVLLLIGFAIYWLCEALRAVASGDLFSAAIVRRFRLFALWMLIAALFNTLAPMVLAMAGLGSVGRHRFMVLIDVRDLLLISLTLLLFLIARMFERARAIEDEMSEIV